MTTIPIDRMSPQGRLAPLTSSFPRTWFGAALRGLKWLPAAPARPAPRDRAREAASVRALANSYLRTDPRFAADLYAAADRHEEIDGD
ncbi:hypothetical protein [Piscinibacter sp.]|uniref:hypothetical protein n=1 Tax=Piscinibacter sp. TaxID=1903157 RepID=UPI002F3E20EA